MKRILGLLALATICASALGQTTTYTGTIKDLTGAAVTSGRITFTLKPSGVSSISGTGSFVSTTVSCLIDASGHPVAASDGVSACTVTSNAALTPTGTYYNICIQPQYISPGSCLNAFAFSGSVDITTLVPTPATQPSYGVGAAGGIAPLDSTGKVPVANLPYSGITPDGSNGLIVAGAFTAQRINGVYTPGTALTTALSGCSSSPCTIEVNYPLTISANTTIPANVTLDFSSPGALNPSAGVTVTINGPITAPVSQQIFGGAGSIAGLKTVRPEWFGGTSSAAMAAALAACSTQGCDMRLQLGTYQSPWVASPMGKDHVRIFGSGEGDYAVGNASVVGGTIIQGSVFANAHYFEAHDLCVDVGATFIGGGTAQDGIKIDNLGQTVGAAQWQSPLLENVCVLGKNASASVHAILLENVNNAKVTNVRTRFNVDGLVLKGTNSVVNGYVGSGHNTAALYIKADTFAISTDISVSGVHVSGVSAGDTVGVVLDGGSGILSRVTVDGVTGNNLSVGAIFSNTVSDAVFQNFILETMTGGGIKANGTVQRLKIANGIVNNPGTIGIAFQGGGVNYSTISSVQVTNSGAGWDGVAIDGQDNKLSNVYTRGSGGYGLHLTGVTPINAWQDGFTSFSDTLGPIHLDSGAVVLNATSTQGNFASVNSSASVYSGSGSVTVSALTTATVLPSTAGLSGILRLRDNTSGGSAVFLIDPNSGSQLLGTSQITGITTAAAVTFSGGNWNVTLASGSVPRIIAWTIYD